jgi:hypothetical protein
MQAWHHSLVWPVFQTKQSGQIQADVISKQTIEPVATLPKPAASSESWHLHRPSWPASRSEQRGPSPSALQQWSHRIRPTARLIIIHRTDEQHLSIIHRTGSWARGEGSRMCWTAAVAQWVTLAAGSFRAVGWRHVREPTTRWRSTTCGSRVRVGARGDPVYATGRDRGRPAHGSSWPPPSSRKGALRLCAARHPDSCRRCLE